VKPCLTTSLPGPRPASALIASSPGGQRLGMPAFRLERRRTCPCLTQARLEQFGRHPLELLPPSQQVQRVGLGIGRCPGPAAVADLGGQGQPLVQVRQRLLVAVAAVQVEAEVVAGPEGDRPQAVVHGELQGMGQQRVALDRAGAPDQDVRLAEPLALCGQPRSPSSTAHPQAARADAPSRCQAAWGWSRLSGSHQELAVRPAHQQTAPAAVAATASR
jgi:hypothetical protein